MTNRWSLAKTNTTYGYDAVGNVMSVTYPLSHSLSFSYDAVNQLTNMLDAVGTTKFGYTATGQLASETGPWTGDTVSYVYSDELRSSLTLQQPNGSDWVVQYGDDSGQSPQFGRLARWHIQLQLQFGPQRDGDLFRFNRENCAAE